MDRVFVLALSCAILFVGCSTSAPTPDVPAIQTDAARSVFATQTADAGSVSGIQTRAAQSVFATQAAVAAQVRPTIPLRPTATPIPPTWEFAITNIEKTTTLKAGRSFTAKGTYVIVNLTIKNISKRNSRVNRLATIVQDAIGNEYASDEGTAFQFLVHNGQSDMFAPNVPPGISVETMFVFDVNPEATGLMLCLADARECQSIEK